MSWGRWALEASLDLTTCRQIMVVSVQALTRVCKQFIVVQERKDIFFNGVVTGKKLTLMYIAILGHLLPIGASNKSMKA